MPRALMLCVAMRYRAGRGEAYVLDYLLERKAAGDLASSIKDGRYGRQKVAMRATGLRRLLYVLEGEPGTLPSASFPLGRHFHSYSLLGVLASRADRSPQAYRTLSCVRHRQLVACDRSTAHA